MFRPFAAAALIALTVTATAARAETIASVDVAFGDLNLSHTGDAKILADRLKVAARSVCNVDLSPLTLAARKEQQLCMHNAINGAMDRIGSKLANNVRSQIASNTP